jgi:transposase-like protein
LLTCAWCRPWADDRQTELVKLAREQGTTWAEIAAAIGVTRQAAWERWHEFDGDDTKP